ncbi:MAG: hypothetical protein ACI8UR_000199 [Natronomonas sp.]|jgi:hypothetical protein
MLAQTCRATLTVRVPRGAVGDVEGGVRDVLDGVEGVDNVEVHNLEGVRPDALDLYVDASVTVAFETGIAAPDERLRDGFGVVAVAAE